MKNINKKGFTFVELIIVMVLLTILGTIGLYSYVGYIGDSRDSQRKADISKISSALKIYKQKRGYYSIPGDSFNITYSGTVVAMQGKLNTEVRLNSLDSLPSDPKNKIFYSYSVTSNKQEFEIGTTLENEERNISLKEGNYKSVSKNILPTLLLATGAIAGSNIEIKAGTTIPDLNRKLFVYNGQSHNLLYTFKTPFPIYSDGTSFTSLLSEMETDNLYWQNSDYRNCTEISEGGKLILPLTATSFEYQIITDTGALVNTGCTL